MPRKAHATDFFVDVPDLGRFNFARRQLGDVFKIRGRYNQLTEGFYDAEGRMADLVALAYVTIQTLLVSGPEGFDLDTLDPLLDDEFDTKLLAIWSALRDKELSFRSGQKEARQAPGPGTGQQL
ncbi:MAG TPA: hypothetical protein VF472_07380 [Burkholderiaceae bacterium]